MGVLIIFVVCVCMFPEREEKGLIEYELIKLSQRLDLY